MKTKDIAITVPSWKFNGTLKGQKVIISGVSAGFEEVNLKGTVKGVYSDHMEVCDGSEYFHELHLVDFLDERITIKVLDEEEEESTLNCPSCDDGKLIVVDEFEFLKNEKGEYPKIYGCTKCGVQTYKGNQSE